MTHTFFAARTAFPPSFDGQPVTYMWAVFGLLLLELVALEWFWRLLWQPRVAKGSWRHPLVIHRSVILLMLMSPILGGFPDLLLLMLWPEIGAEARETLARMDRLLDGVVWIPFSLAWLLAQFGRGMIDFQLLRHPIPINLWPTGAQARHSLKIGAGVFAIAFAVTFLR